MLTDEENREAYRKGDAYSSQDKADVKREGNEQQPWRTEPEIDRARQKQLMQCLATAPNITQGIYPFTRADLSESHLELADLREVHLDTYYAISI